jgi:hypothetical protein
MRALTVLVATVLLGAATASQAQENPVVVELFTSQGCSSCPPADAFFAELAERDGVIALALHVDYWDYLGWKDSFGSPQFSARQRAYAKAARSRSVFTPQMIVQGQDRWIGHDAERVLGSIAEHGQARSPVRLRVERETAALRIKLEPLDAAVGPSDVHVVRFIPSHDVSIDAGENAGRQFTYSNIVTDWETIGHWDGATPIELVYDAPGPEPLAVIVQRVRMGPVVTAARLP